MRAIRHTLFRAPRVLARDICDVSLADVAATLETNENSAKALLHRARSALADARRHVNVDVPCDVAVVERFARAIEEGSIERLSELLAEDAWGVVDGGGIIQAAKKPNFGRRAISRQWENGKRRLGQPVTAEIRHINGESAIVIRLVAALDIVVAVVHLETHDEHVVALRVNRDPRRVAYLGGLCNRRVPGGQARAYGSEPSGTKRPGFPQMSSARGGDR